MKQRLVLPGISALMLVAAVSCLAGEVKVIANTSVREDTISAGELKRVFLKESISLADGSHVEPVIEKDGAVHEAFLQQYLGMSNDDLQTYYRTLLFTGKGAMPKAFASDAEVVAYVARTRGAVGYVSDAANVKGVKTITVVLQGIRTERKLITRVEPDYPDTLRRLNIGGTVRLRISIAAKGNVEYVELMGGNPILAEAAMIAVRKWVYAADRSRTVEDLTIVFGPH